MTSISIITVCHNAEATISDCLASIQRQTWPLEHILIDGGSADRTVDIIRAQSPTAQMVSEPDYGIYDAMNKGLRLATGDIIGFLNADDFYACPDILEKVSRAFTDSRIDSCYGDLVYVDSRHTDTVRRYWLSGQYAPNRFYWGWMPPHPTFFVRRSVYEKYGGFNLDLGSAADYEIMLRFLMRHRIQAAYIPEVLVKMRTGGVSNASLENRIKANKMDRKAWRVNGLKPYPWTLWMKPARKIGQYFLKPTGSRLKAQC